MFYYHRIADVNNSHIHQRLIRNVVNLLHFPLFNKHNIRFCLRDQLHMSLVFESWLSWLFLHVQCLKISSLMPLTSQLRDDAFCDVATASGRLPSLEGVGRFSITYYVWLPVTLWILNKSLWWRRRSCQFIMQIISHWEMFIRNSSCSLEINTTGMLLLVTYIYCEPSILVVMICVSAKTFFWMSLPVVIRWVTLERMCLL